MTDTYLLMCAKCRLPTRHRFNRYSNVGAFGSKTAQARHMYQCDECETIRQYGSTERHVYEAPITSTAPKGFLQ